MGNVVILGLISFFADIGTEMIYPIIPLYLTSAFGATPALVGVIEGCAESIASLLKVFSGHITDRYQKKKPLAFLGYSTGLMYKLLLLFATSWVGVLIARLIDRIGKGTRTSPRDVMVSESTTREKMGMAFGLHKSLDMAGSSIGIFTAFLLMKSMSGGDVDYKKIFLVALIPTCIALFMFTFVKEKKPKANQIPKEKFWKNIRKINPQLRLYLVIVLLFTLGNSSNSFLLLRAQNVGFDDTYVILMYFIYTATASLLAIPMGKLSDKVGRKALLAGGYLVFTIVYLGFAFAPSKPLIILTFIIYGVYTSMTVGVERALVAEITPYELRGTMLGLQATIQGIALLPASTVCGFLWNQFGPQVPFMFGATLAFTAAVLLIVFFRPEREGAVVSQ